MVGRKEESERWQTSRPIFNGDWLPLSEVKISPLDRGFTTGDVVFDVARTFNG